MNKDLLLYYVVHNLEPWLSFECDILECIKTAQEYQTVSGHVRKRIAEELTAQLRHYLTSYSAYLTNNSFIYHIVLSSVILRNALAIPCSTGENLAVKSLSRIFDKYSMQNSLSATSMPLYVIQGAFPLGPKATACSF